MKNTEIEKMPPTTEKGSTKLNGAISDKNSDVSVKVCEQGAKDDAKCTVTAANNSAPDETSSSLKNGVSAPATNGLVADMLPNRNANMFDDNLSDISDESMTLHLSDEEDETPQLEKDNKTTSNTLLLLVPQPANDNSDKAKEDTEKYISEEISSDGVSAKKSKKKQSLNDSSENEIIDIEKNTDDEESIEANDLKRVTKKLSHDDAFLKSEKDTSSNDLFVPTIENKNMDSNISKPDKNNCNSKANENKEPLEDELIKTIDETELSTPIDKNINNLVSESVADLEKSIEESENFNLYINEKEPVLDAINEILEENTSADNVSKKEVSSKRKTNSTERKSRKKKKRKGMHFVHIKKTRKFMRAWNEARKNAYKEEETQINEEVTQDEDKIPDKLAEIQNKVEEAQDKEEVIQENDEDMQENDEYVQEQEEEAKDKEELKKQENKEMIKERKERSKDEKNIIDNEETKSNEEKRSDEEQTDSFQETEQSENDIQMDLDEVPLVLRASEKINEDANTNETVTEDINEEEKGDLENEFSEEENDITDKELILGNICSEDIDLQVDSENGDMVKEESTIDSDDQSNKDLPEKNIDEEIKYASEMTDSLENDDDSNKPDITMDDDKGEEKEEVVNGASEVPTKKRTIEESIEAKEESSGEVKKAKFDYNYIKKDVLELKQKKEYVSLDSFKNFMSTTMKKLTRKELEEFCIQKLCEVIGHVSELGELRHQVKKQELMIESWRNRVASLTKQQRDVEIVNCRLLTDMRNRAKDGGNIADAVPVKITRSVGLQVCLQTVNRRNVPVPAAPIVALPQTTQQPTTEVLHIQQKRKPAQRMSLPSRISAAQTMQNIIPTAKSITPTKPGVPQVRTMKVTPPRTPEISKDPSLINKILGGPKQMAIPNNITSNTSNQAANRKSVSSTDSARGVIDLTDEDETNKAIINTKNMRVIPPHQINSTTQVVTSGSPLAAPTVAGPRVTYLVGPGQQAQPVIFATSTTPTRPGQVRSTIMLKPITGAVGNQRMNSLIRPGNQVTMLPQAPRQSIRFSNMQVNQRNVIQRIQPMRHPAPLPGPPTLQPSQPNWKAMPPKPSLKISRVGDGIVLSWKMLTKDLSMYEEIASYQLYAYQETNAPPDTEMWRKVGDVKALTLPMACTLTQFIDGNKYHFAVRAVDVKSRVGPFSQPEQIMLS